MLNWQSWTAQSLPRSEIMRGGAAVWPNGAQRLVGDSLGPTMHSHDLASEIFYFVAGQCRLQIGDTTELLGPGDLVLIPPDVPHNLWNAGTKDLLVFWLVAPHFVGNMWRTENFVEGAMKTRAARSHVQAGAPLPSNGQIGMRIVMLGVAAADCTADGSEAVVYVAVGSAVVNVGNLGGTLASVARHGLAIQTGMMARLNLRKPDLPWHNSRDNIAEFCAVLSLISATMGKIAQEIINLQRTEVGEVEEPFNVGKVGSSTMPHKRNPMLCEAAVALARLVARNMPVALDAMIQTHERDWIGDHLEWALVPEICIMCDGALSLTTRVLGGVQVYPEQMQRNLDRLGGLMLSEAVMLALAAKIGRQTAHDIVYECSMKTIEEKKSFRQTLAAHPTVKVNLSIGEIEQLLDPAQYTGLASYYVDQVISS